MNLNKLTKKLKSYNWIFDFARREESPVVVSGSILKLPNNKWKATVVLYNQWWEQNFNTRGEAIENVLNVLENFKRW